MSLFKFNPIVEKEKMDLVAGEASFRVVAIFDKNKDGSPLTTLNGDPKLNISFSMIDSAGNQGLVYDDLTQKTGWKAKALLGACGLPVVLDEQDQVVLSTDDLKGCVGKCELEVKKSEGYADRMSIKRYIKRDALLNAANVKKDYSDELGDPQEIPF